MAGSERPGGGARWRVFISHTSDLRDFPAGRSYVTEVERAVSACGHVIVDMADLPAATQPPAQLCVERVRGCEVYIGLLGARYGSPVPDRPEVSYTELEFDTASEAQVDRLVFLLADGAGGVPPLGAAHQELAGRQEAFRRRVAGSGLTVQSFASPDELGRLVERSLRHLADLRGVDATSRVVAGEIPQEPLGFLPRTGLLAGLDAGGTGGRVVHAYRDARGGQDAPGGRVRPGLHR